VHDPRSEENRQPALPHRTRLCEFRAPLADKSTIDEAIRYSFNQWDSVVRFLDDGRIEMDTNSVERAMRPIALNRKDSLFPVMTRVPQAGPALHL
jgi:transposase